jgi:hypothetical protein
MVLVFLAVNESTVERICLISLHVLLSELFNVDRCRCIKGPDLHKPLISLHVLLSELFNVDRCRCIKGPDLHKPLIIVRHVRKIAKSDW